MFLLLLYLLLQKPAKKSYERPRTTAFLSRSTAISARVALLPACGHLTDRLD